MENKDYIQQSLADKDINSSIKDGKVVVHKDNKNAAKAHLKKIGHGHVQVVSELNVSFIDYLKEKIKEEPEENLTLEDFSIEELETFMESEEFEQLDEISKKTLGSYIKKASDSKVSAGIGIVTKTGKPQDIDADKYLKRNKGIAIAVKKLTKEETIVEEHKTEDVHINDIKVGDAVYHNGNFHTVGNKDIKHSSSMGRTLFGDSYSLGHKPVKRVVYK